MDAASVHSSRADVWHLKNITFETKPVKIITQNFNGPCSFIAICNILILRGQIQILPPDRTTVSYEFLSQLVGEYLLTNCPDMDISAALSVMPSTTKGLDLNPQFTSITAFSLDSDAGELDLFAQAGIQLVHGWVVDPDSPEAEAMTQMRDYDTAVTMIADADYITHGRLLTAHNDGNDNDNDGDADAQAGPSSSSSTPRPHTRQYSDEDQRKIEQAIVAQRFLDATQSQLTYHGLFQLASTLQPGSLVALFRNAHLSVVYKSLGGTSVPIPVPVPASTATQPSDAETTTKPTPTPTPTPNSDGATTTTTSSTSTPPPTATPSHPTLDAASQDPALYALVTDDVFLHEPSIVWERLEDVDGGASWFVDSDLRRAVPVGGDVAGQSAEAALRRFLEMEAGVVDPVDHALAQQMQAEEDAHARDAYMRRQQALARRRTAHDGNNDDDGKRRTETAGNKRGKKKKDRHCVMM